MSETPAKPVELTWKAHPARERRGPAAAAVVTILAFGAATALFMGSVAWGVFGVLILVAALNRFFLPSRFSIDGEGITAQYALQRRRLRWADLRRVVRDGHGAYLGTRARRSWLDAYRGVHVLFGDQREAVMRSIRDHMSPQGEARWAR